MLIPVESQSLTFVKVQEPTIRIQSNRKRRQLKFNIINDRDTCCKYVCQCKVDSCSQPKCEEFHYLLLASNFQPTVGQCCQPFECRPKQCLTDDHKILIQGESKLSEYDPCIECRCHDGNTRCSTHHCAPLSCLHQIQSADECCPKCDQSKSTFCLNDENCDRACRHGYIKHTNGCDLCQCQPGNITKVILTTSSTSTTVTTTESDDWETSTHYVIIGPELHNITTSINEHTFHKGLFVILLCLAVAVVAVTIWIINIGQNRWIPLRFC